MLTLMVWARTQNRPYLDLDPVSDRNPPRPNPKPHLNFQVLEWLQELLNDPDFNLDCEEEVR